MSISFASPVTFSLTPSARVKLCVRDNALVRDAVARNRATFGKGYFAHPNIMIQGTYCGLCKRDIVTGNRVTHMRKVEPGFTIPLDYTPRPVTKADEVSARDGITSRTIVTPAMLATEHYTRTRIADQSEPKVRRSEKSSGHVTLSS